jgi:hypothetical protein
VRKYTNSGCREDGIALYTHFVSVRQSVDTVCPTLKGSRRPTASGPVEYWLAAGRYGNEAATSVCGEGRVPY